MGHYFLDTQYCNFKVFTPCLCNFPLSPSSCLSPATIFFIFHPLCTLILSFLGRNFWELLSPYKDPNPTRLNDTDPDPNSNNRM